MTILAGLEGLKGGLDDCRNIPITLIIGSMSVIAWLHQLIHSAET